MADSENQFLKVTLIQPDIAWEDVGANLRMVESLLLDHNQKSDVFILPETFSTGFTMQVEKYAESEFDLAIQWMIRLAQRKKAMVIGGMIFRENDTYFNRLYWITPSGIEGFYDKRHLFRMGREQNYFSSGKERKVIAHRGFRVLPLICYDIRFPVFSRNRNDYDILLYIANWPAARQQVWEVLLQARAIENQAYVIGLNRTGTDGEGVAHEGGSCVINPYGQKVAGLDNRPGLLDFKIPLQEIVDFRAKFPAWKDADDFQITF